jgi:MFS transporter, FSR family, fosmidomycin resistance protein
MRTQNEATGLRSNQKIAENTVFAVLIAISVSHLLNDTIQSLIPAIYPILKNSFRLSFTQIGLITLTFQLTASLLQPFVGLYTDHRPKPYSLATGMVPGKVGMIAGLFFGFAFGMAGIGSAVLGRLADQTSISFVFLVCSFLPLIGLLTAFLPDLNRAAPGSSR